MPQLEADIRSENREDAVAGEFALSVTFTNSSEEPARLNVHQASHPALVLDVRDRNDRVVLLPGDLNRARPTLVMPELANLSVK
jgi:hypothetical protein